MLYKCSLHLFSVAKKKEVAVHVAISVTSKPPSALLLGKFVIAIFSKAKLPLSLFTLLLLTRSISRSFFISKVSGHYKQSKVWVVI